MPLGRPTEVGLGPGDVVLDGDPPPPPNGKGAQQLPVIGPCLLWPNSRPTAEQDFVTGWVGSVSWLLGWAGSKKMDPRTTICSILPPSV